jgi:CHAD domain-containing protein
MGYTFARDGASVEIELRRIATERLNRALTALEAEGDPGAAAHEARKNLKKLRGLLRLVRPAFDDYAAENAALRDIARALATRRRSSALVETHDRLMAHYGAGLDGAAFAGLRDWLGSAEAAAPEGEAPEAPDEAALLTALRDARDRAARWELSKSGFAAVEGGLKKTYGRAVEAMQTARRERTGEAFHEWRKRVKYHWYHARLLKKTAKAELKPRIALAARLNDILGDHHDLVELAPRLEDAPIGPGPRATFQALVAGERLGLEEEALRLGPELLDDSPGKLAKRWKGWWKAA